MFIPFPHRLIIPPPLPEMDLASFHLKTVDELLTEGNIEAVLDQINLAEI